MQKEKSIKKEKESQSKDEVLQNNIKAALDEIYKLPMSINFKTPVDTKIYSNYTTLIKQPMDLGKIKKQIKGNKYKSKKEFQEDLALIWQNCKKFNLEGSQIWIIANDYEKKCNKIIKKHFTQKRVKQGKKQSFEQNDKSNKDTTIILSNPSGKKSGMKNITILNNQQNEENSKLNEQQQQTNTKQKSKNQSALKQKIQQEKSENSSYNNNLVNLNPNPMTQEQRDILMNIINNSDEQQLFEMAQIIDKYENHNINPIQRDPKTFSFEIQIDLLNKLTIQKMIDAIQKNQNYCDALTSQELKQDDFLSKQDEDCPVIIEKYSQLK